MSHAERPLVADHRPSLLSSRPDQLDTQQPRAMRGGGRALALASGKLHGSLVVRRGWDDARGVRDVEAAAFRPLLLEPLRSPRTCVCVCVCAVCALCCHHVALVDALPPMSGTTFETKQLGCLHAVLGRSDALPVVERRVCLDCFLAWPGSSTLSACWSAFCLVLVRLLLPTPSECFLSADWCDVGGQSPDISLFFADSALLCALAKQPKPLRPVSARSPWVRVKFANGTAERGDPAADAELQAAGAKRLAVRPPSRGWNCVVRALGRNVPPFTRAVSVSRALRFLPPCLPSRHVVLFFWMTPFSKRSLWRRNMLVADNMVETFLEAHDTFLLLWAVPEAIVQLAFRKLIQPKTRKERLGQVWAHASSFALECERTPIRARMPAPAWSHKFRVLLRSTVVQAASRPCILASSSAAARHPGVSTSIGQNKNAASATLKEGHHRQPNCNILSDCQSLSSCDLVAPHLRPLLKQSRKRRMDTSFERCRIALCPLGNACVVCVANRLVHRRTKQPERRLLRHQRSASRIACSP